ncbi:MAG: bifunctional 5,10-methylenetetrahydrofolate dehydrogenase/5,10-methenyltetrahydrofolate cyclohydrolase [Acidimicrobiales bacterium]|nr:bifunctional 5,10-methylenetetrahydrofolate dehydrogenase/5,10-methenyltetrahydrofolate cyclohydrolase [Acidimicrobiales bacterium]
MMTAVLMPGKPVAESIEKEVLESSAIFLQEKGRKPGLATILVGDDASSARYIAMKQKKAQELGFESPHIHLSRSATTEDLLRSVESFNNDPNVDAMLIQYPAPSGIDFDKALSEVLPNKDADGMHPMNMGRLALSIPGPIPCTPAGIEAILKYYQIEIGGKHVAILGRGLTLGRPLSLLLSQKRAGADAAVTILHSGVLNWRDYTREADIVIGAVGVPGIITKTDVKVGAVVIGAGVRYEGNKLLPDVLEEVEEVASFITPRVGGVGPTTVAMLFRNAMDAAFGKFG